MKKIMIVVGVVLMMLISGTLGGFLFNYVFYSKVATHPVWSQSPFVKSMDNRLHIIKQTEKVVVQNSESIADIAQTPAATVVHVAAVGEKSTILSEGNGIIVSSDGVIATVSALVPQMATVYVTFADGTVKEATSLYRDVYSGLAFLRVDAQNLPTIAFANSDDAQSGKRLISVARDRTGTQTSFSAGGVMGAMPHFSIQSPSSDYVQGVLAIDFADTVLAAAMGAPVVDYQGNMVGLIARKVLPETDTTEAETIYYAVAANDVYESFGHYLQLGQAVPQTQKTFVSDSMTLGVEYATLTVVDVAVEALTVHDGARVLAVPVTSRGARSGIHVGDIITAVNDKQLDGMRNVLARVLRGYKPTDTVELTVVRGKDTLTLPIVK